MSVLSLNNVKKSYKLGDGSEFPVLKGINVSFDKGELVSIIGESGSGKSTLMNIIGGLDSKFEGEVLVDGKNIGAFTEKELDIYRKNKIGFIFQSFNLVPHLTILDNVALALTLSNVKRSEQVERAKEMLEKVGLKDHIHKKPNQLSGGQMQRVAIARALINDPEMIVADEPTGSLDSQTTQQILDIITQIAQEGKLVLLVTHSEHVAECSSRVIRIADGQIVEDRQGITLTPKETAETAKTKEISKNLNFAGAIKLAFKNMKEKKMRNILVNTQAESVVLWSNKNGAHKIDYFTFRNIIGRAGRMFRYFVGRVYMLEEPPSQENTKLRLEFPDDVVKKLDGNDPGIKLNNEQYVKIQRYQDEMIELLGTDIWHRIERIPQIRSCKPSMLKIIAEKLKTDSNWPTNCDALQNNNTWEWRDALGDIIEILEYHRKGHLRYYACACSNGWKMTIKELYNTVKDYGITYEDIFTFERYVSFNLSSIIAVINIIRQELYPNSSNIANFVYKASNAFLPKIVFQLEEYGLPRMISKKIQNAGLINLEDDSKEITIVIQEFNTIGIEYLEQKIPNLHSFDKYILKHFMNGIRCITTNQKN